jgi:4-hydroxy-4-methyl-2-oxoglutarate aldolase
MIDDPPLIRMKRDVRRPGAEQVRALTGVPTGFIVDAMDGRGAMSAAVKPVIAGQTDFCGPAVTCHAGPADNLAIAVALSAIAPGDVLVAATDAFMETAVIGDLVLGMGRNGGLAAFVTDGCVRDTPGIRDVGLPCFAAGVTPNSPAKNGPGTVNLPVTLAGLHVAPGDIVAGDVDGVVVVPFDAIDEVIRRLETVRRKEDEMLAAVEGGLSAPGYVDEMRRDGRIVEVD